METSKKSILRGYQESTSLPVDSHAKTSRLREKEKEWLAKEVVYGASSPVLLAKFDPVTLSWRTFQTLLISDSKKSLQTFPKSGMIVNGSLYALPNSEPYTAEKEYSLLPTPTASEEAGGVRKTRGKRRMMQRVRDELILIGTMVASNRIRSPKHHVGRLLQPHELVLLPTIGANEFKGSGAKRWKGSKDFRGSKMSEGLRICSTDPIYLNPSFAEAVMGFPIGWTELNPSETQSYQSLRSSLRGKSKKKREGKS